MMKPQKGNEAEGNETLVKMALVLDELLAARQERRGRLMDVLNSPFIVAAIGGLALTLLSLVWQSRDANRRDALARSERVYSRKQALLLKFIGRFGDSINLLTRRGERELWVLCRQPDTSDTYPTDGADFKQVMREFKALDATYRASENIGTLCHHIEHFYDAEPVRKAARKLAGTVREILKLAPAEEGPSSEKPARDDLYQLKDRAVDESKKAIREMLKEIRGAE